MNNSKLGGLLAVGALFSMLGCGSSYSASISGVTPMPDGSFLTSSTGHLHTGIAAAFTPLVSEHDTWGTSQETDDIAVTSSNPGVLQAAPVASGGKWIVWAVAPGSAELSITQDGNVAGTIVVDVTDPAQ